MYNHFIHYTLPSLRETLPGRGRVAKLDDLQASGEITMLAMRGYLKRVLARRNPVCLDSPQGEYFLANAPMQFDSFRADYCGNSTTSHTCGYGLNLAYGKAHHLYAAIEYALQVALRNLAPRMTRELKIQS